MYRQYVQALVKGLRTGMLLQLAVGPVCLLVLNTAASLGFIATLPLIAAVALADALYVFLSCLGAAAIVNQKNVRTAAYIIGSLVLVAFGLDMLLGALGFTLLPGIHLFSIQKGDSLFMKGLLMTLSNPLTILFWSGMLSTKVAENDFNKSELSIFAAGCVLATVAFLTPASFLASLAGGALPTAVIPVLNGLVGATLIFFGIKMVCKRQDK